MRLATFALACIALLAAGFAPAAAAIVRCETADGRVIYSNSDCPPNSKLVRKVEQSPPVVANPGGRPPARPGEAPARVQPSPARGAADPARVDEELSAQLAEQRRECDERARELQRLGDDVAAASPANRASAELALRRAQDDFRALCPRPR
ncbi:MAG: hypothetical protein MUF32_04300 [Burkholderiaceae bacterium]|jgi:uncharacterized coiled-coil protein SlyX|nr:hypothetical protein [Burkholderiaceae bacterium]